MKTVAGAEYRLYRLPLREMWQSSRGGLAERAGFIIRLSAGGLRGYGDCAPLPGAGTETPEAAIAWLEQELPRLRGMPPETALESLPSSASCPPAARCGLETALLDLCARLDNRPLSRRLDPGAVARVRTNASIGVLNEHTGNRILNALGEGFDVLKVKVGIHRIDLELEALREFSKSLPGGVHWRLDANRVWTLPQARRFLEGLQGLPVEAVEEPLAKPDPDRWRSLQARAPCPLAVDESLGMYGLEHWVARGGVRRILIKPMALGGLLPALSLAKTARQLGVEGLVTTTVDSAVGTWAAVHLAAALGEGTHGLATSAWLARDVAEPPRIEGGVIEILAMGGLGLDGVGQSLAWQDAGD